MAIGVERASGVQDANPRDQVSSGPGPIQGNFSGHLTCNRQLRWFNR